MYFPEQSWGKPCHLRCVSSKMAVTPGNNATSLLARVTAPWLAQSSQYRRQVEEYAVHADGREPDNLTSNEEKPGCRDPAPPAGMGNNCSSAAALSSGPHRCQSVSLTLSTFQRLSVSLHDGVYIQSDLRVAKIAVDAAITEKGRSGRVIFSSAAREEAGRQASKT